MGLYRMLGHMNFADSGIFQKNSVVVDKIGNHTNSWSDYYTCYATICGEGGNEQAVVVQTVENAELYFTVRYCLKVFQILRL